MAPLPQEKAQRPERRAQGSARSDPVSLSSPNYLLLNTLSSFSPLGLCAWNILPLIRLTYSHSSGIGNGFTCDKASLTPTSPKARLVTTLMGPRISLSIPVIHNIVSRLSSLLAWEQAGLTFLLVTASPMLSTGPDT